MGIIKHYPLTVSNYQMLERISKDVQHVQDMNVNLIIASKIKQEALGSHPCHEKQFQSLYTFAHNYDSTTLIKMGKIHIISYNVLIK